MNLTSSAYLACVPNTDLNAQLVFGINCDEFLKTMKIYKYRDDTNPFTKNVLSNGEIYFASYSELNDPFEYSFSWTTTADLSAKVTKWSEVGDYYKTELQSMKPEDQVTFIDKLERSLAPPSDSFFRDKDLGVFSASEIWNNLVLWSHYANSHRGVCFEFETHSDINLNSIHKVEYNDAPAPYDLYQGSKPIDYLTRKHTDWQYERELRSFGKKGRYVFNRCALTGMIIGAQATYEKQTRKNIAELIELLKSNFPAAKIEILRRSDSTFSLEKDELRGSWIG